MFCSLVGLRHVRGSVCGVCLALLVGCASQSGPGPASTAEDGYLALMSGTGTDRQLERQLEMAMLQLHLEHPEWGAEIACIEAVVSADAVLEMVRPVYERMLSEADMRGLATFFSSTAGQKVAAASRRGVGQGQIFQGLSEQELAEVGRYLPLFARFADPKVLQVMQRESDDSVRWMVMQAADHCEKVVQRRKAI